MLLRAWRGGDAEALSALAPLVYRELRKIANSHMRRENQGRTLTPTALVNVSAAARQEKGVLRLEYLRRRDTLGEFKPSGRRERVKAFSYAMRIQPIVLIERIGRGNCGIFIGWEADAHQFYAVHLVIHNGVGDGSGDAAACVVLFGDKDGFGFFNQRQHPFDIKGLNRMQVGDCQIDAFAGQTLSGLAR